MGHNSVKLLWRNENTKLPYNRQIAVSKLKSLENELIKARILLEISENYWKLSEKGLCNKIKYQRMQRKQRNSNL